ncbi:MAG: GbsR/MarR family transcriptional regulator [Candidatus Aenigmatarchaeota archaeon]
MPDGKAIKDKIFSTFADLASSLGYSPIHGKIIGALLVAGEPLSLQDLARETGYSTSMVSLSLDLLEVLGVIKKVKKTADRKLYISLSGDLVASLKTALLVRVKKSIDDSLAEFSESRRQLKKLRGKERARLDKTLSTLEAQIKRLQRYVNLLSGIRLP